MVFRRHRLKRPFHNLAVLMTAALPMFFFFPAAARADIYRYIDSKGVLHFTNVPTDPAFRLYMKEKGRPKKSAVRPSPSQYDTVIAEAARRHGVSPEVLG